MCRNYGGMATDYILKIRLLKEKALQRKEISEGLVCDCKKQILEEYINSLENLIVVVNAYCQTLGLVRSQRRAAIMFDSMMENYNREAFERLYKSCNISHRLLFLFEYILGKITSVSFEKIKRMAVKYTGSVNGEKFKVCQFALDEIFDLAEIGIMTLSGIRVNTFNLNWEVVKDVISHADLEYHPFNTEKLVICPHREMNCGDGGYPEYLVIYVVPEFYDIKDFLDDYYDIIEEYHCAPYKINLILDYRLIPESYSWSPDCQRRLDRCLKIFKSVKIKNIMHLELGEFYGKILPYIDITELSCEIETIS